MQLLAAVNLHMELEHCGKLRMLKKLLTLWEADVSNKTSAQVLAHMECSSLRLQ